MSGAPLVMAAVQKEFYELWQILSYGNCLKGVLQVMAKVELWQLLKRNFMNYGNNLSYGRFSRGVP